LSSKSIGFWVEAGGTADAVLVELARTLPNRGLRAVIHP
jgi:hypothetical protein